MGKNKIRNSIYLGKYGDLIGKKGTIALMLTDLKQYNALHISHKDGQIKIQST